MKSKSLFLVLLALTLSNIPALLAQGGDVCCLMSKVTEGAVEVRAMGTSASECKSGGSSGEYVVCVANPDPNNTCPSTPIDTICRSCGYHWTGNSCLAEDPVKKAKKELKEEDEKKKKKDEKAKTPPN